MSAYISEIQFFGDTSREFVEVAVDQGTDVSGYRLHFYMADGTVWRVHDLGGYTATMDGKDVYVLDDSTPGFASSDESGNFYADDALALVDDEGEVIQFISWYGFTVTATDGPAAGMTSENIGSPNNDDSMQSNDEGATYFSQSNQNSGTIPACYGAGTLIATPSGTKRVEDLRIGDEILSACGAPIAVKWLWSEVQIFKSERLSQMPVLIRKGAFGGQRPSRDLIVSGQHRIAVGVSGQLEDHFAKPGFAPAKALVGLAGITFLTEAESIEWFHIVCDEHSLIWANDILSETMLLAPWVIGHLGAKIRRHLVRDFGGPVVAQSAALPCLPVGQIKRRLRAEIRIQKLDRPCITLH